MMWKITSIVYPKLAICTSPIIHLACPRPPPPFPKILHNLCSSFLLGITVVPREIEDNAYALGGGATKVYLGDVKMANAEMWTATD